MLAGGHSVHDVARVMRVHPRTVKRWRRRPQQKQWGGARRGLSEQQQQQARLALLHHFNVDEDGIRRAAKIIREATGVEYHPDHVRRILKRLKVLGVPRGVQFGAYNTTKHRCPVCRAKLVKRICYACFLQGKVDGSGRILDA